MWKVAELRAEGEEGPSCVVGRVAGCRWIGEEGDVVSVAGTAHLLALMSTLPGCFFLPRPKKERRFDDLVSSDGSFPS